VDKETELLDTIKDSDGKDRVTIYIEETRQKKTLPPSKNITAEAKIIEKLESIFGENNVKVV
jgi:DNA polymerase-3 subunit alpha